MAKARKVSLVTLSVITLAFGLLVWWGAFSGLIFTSKNVFDGMIAVLILVCICSAAYMFYSLAAPIDSKTKQNSLSQTVLTIITYIVAALAVLSNVYLIIGTIIDKTTYHNYPQWFYPIVTNAFFAFVLLPVTVTLLARRKRGPLKLSLIALSVSFLLALIVCTLF